MAKATQKQALGRGLSALLKKKKPIKPTTNDDLCHENDSMPVQMR